MMRVEVLWRWDVAADHKLLALVDAHFYPSARAPARLVATVAALGDHAFKALLLDRGDDFGGRGLQGFRKADLFRHPGHHSGAEQFAAIVERTVAQVFAREMQKVEGVELKRRGGVIVVLQDVERGPPGFVQRHNLAVDDAVVRQLRESVCYGRKPG